MQRVKGVSMLTFTVDDLAGSELYQFDLRRWLAPSGQNAADSSGEQKLPSGMAVGLGTFETGSRSEQGLNGGGDRLR
jgi:hypothetical protein